MYHFSWLQLLHGPMGLVQGLLERSGRMSEEAAHSSAIVVLSTWMIALVLLGLGGVARMGLTKARARGGTLQYVPGTGYSLHNLFEIYTESIYNMTVSVLTPKQTRAFYWLFGGMFIYILFGNLLSVIPGGLPPTDNFNNNLAMALTVFLVFNVAGFATNGVGYIKHMMGPVWWLAWLILPIELIGIAVRPLSLSLRLMGNIYGDHMVFGVMSDLVPLIVPSIFLGLGIFVSFLQAFVFTLLSTIYLALSVAHDDGH